jgi:hypothetical protein
LQCNRVHRIPPPRLVTIGRTPLFIEAGYAYDNHYFLKNERRKSSKKQKLFLTRPANQCLGGSGQVGQPFAPADTESAECRYRVSPGGARIGSGRGAIRLPLSPACTLRALAGRFQNYDQHIAVG